MDFLLSLDLSIRVSSLTRTLQEFACFNLPSARIKSAHYHCFEKKKMSSGNQSQVVCMGNTLLIATFPAPPPY